MTFWGGTRIVFGDCVGIMAWLGPWNSADMQLPVLPGSLPEELRLQGLRLRDLVWSGRPESPSMFCDVVLAYETVESGFCDHECTRNQE